MTFDRLLQCVGFVIILPNRPELGPILNAQGRLTAVAKPCSTGEQAFTEIGKPIVENGRRIDNIYREAPVQLLRAVYLPSACAAFSITFSTLSRQATGQNWTKLHK